MAIMLPGQVLAYLSRSWVAPDESTSVLVRFDFLIHSIKRRFCGFHPLGSPGIAESLFHATTLAAGNSMLLYVTVLASQSDTGPKLAQGTPIAAAQSE